MKKITALLLVLAMTIISGTRVMAAKAVKVEKQKEINETTARTFKAGATNESMLIFNKIEMLTERYLNNFRECEPLHVSQDIDFFGLKIGYKIDINGWTNNKCEYIMTGKISSLGKDIREVFELNISDEEIAKFEPIIKCDFTKDQLNILVDAVIANYNKKAEMMVSQMLQDPTDKYNEKAQNKLTPEEEKLIAMLTSGNACTIPNLNELIQQMSTIAPTPPENKQPEK